MLSDEVKSLNVPTKPDFIKELRTSIIKHMHVYLCSLFDNPLILVLIG